MKALLLFVAFVLVLKCFMMCSFILVEMAFSHGKSTILDSILVLKRFIREQISAQYIRLRRRFFA